MKDRKYLSLIPAGQPAPEKSGGGGVGRVRMGGKLRFLQWGSWDLWDELVLRRWGQGRPQSSTKRKII